MVFLLCSAFNCVFPIFAFLLAIPWLYLHSIDHAIIDHSIDHLHLNHSIGSYHMPVITRSRAKFLDVSNELSDVKSTLSSPPELHNGSSLTSVLEHTSLSLPLRSSDSNASSFDSDDDALVFIGNHFEISKFQSSEIAEESSKLSSVHNFEKSQFLPM